MKIKLDENLPVDLKILLHDLGHDVDTVIDEGLSGRDDPLVWKTAQKTGRLLITQDLDFSDLRRYRPGTHHGLVLLRLREPSRRALTRRISTLFQTEDVEFWRCCLVVVTDLKIRIRCPRERKTK